MAPSSLEALIKSIINAPDSAFDDVDKDVLERAANNLAKIADELNGTRKQMEAVVYGFETCAWYKKALVLYNKSAAMGGWVVVPKGHKTRDAYKAWLAKDATKAMLAALDEKAPSHTSSPLCIVNSKFIGGHDDSVKYVQKMTAPPKAVEALVYGYETCPWYKKALVVYNKAAAKCGWVVVPKGHATRAAYKAWLVEDATKAMLVSLAGRAPFHTSSPLCIVDGKFIGGHDDSVKYVQSKLPASSPPLIKVDAAASSPPLIKIDAAAMEAIKDAAKSTITDDAEECYT